MLTLYGDYLFSAAAGIVLAITIVKFGSAPALISSSSASGMEEIKKADESLDHNQSQHPSNSCSEIDSVQCEQGNGGLKLLNEDKIMARSKKIRKLLGLSDEQIQEAIRSTNEELVKGSTSTTSELAEQHDYSWVSMIDTVVMILLVLLSIAVLNSYTNGDAGRVLVGLFPKEFESLKLKEFFEKYHVLKR